MQKKLYPLHNYDNHFCLKVSPLLWLIMLWSILHALALFLGLFASSADVMKMTVEFAYDPLKLASNVPGALLLFARMNRRPEAGGFFRWIWRNGKWLLSAGLAAQIAILLVKHWRDLADVNEAIVLILAGTVACLVALLRSRHIADIFADFPVPETSTDNSAAPAAKS